MSFPLQPDENVYFPMPYVEGEANLLVITNLRVVHFGDEGKQEMPAKQIQFVGRLSTRPLVAVGVILALLALPLAAFGVYSVFTSGLFAQAKATATAPPGDDPSQPQADPAAEGTDDPAAAAAPAEAPSLIGKIAAVAEVAFGLIFLVVGVMLLRIERHYVLLRGGPMSLQIRANSTMEQTQILATVGALQSASKSAPAPAAAAPAAPAVQVDDKGDPVKALQDLAAARAAGKVSDDEFDAKREVLLQRVRARK